MTKKVGVGNAYKLERFVIADQASESVPLMLLLLRNLRTAPVIPTESHAANVSLTFSVG